MSQEELLKALIKFFDLNASERHAYNNQHGDTAIRPTDYLTPDTSEAHMDGADGIIHSDDHYSCLDSASETSLAISQDEGGMSQKSDLAELTCVSDVPKKL